MAAFTLFDSLYNSVFNHKCVYPNDHSLFYSETWNLELYPNGLGSFTMKYKILKVVPKL